MKKYIIIIAAALFTLVSCEKSFKVADSSYLKGTEAAAMVEDDPDFLLSYVNGLYAYMVQYNTSGSSSNVHDDYGYLAMRHMVDLGCQDLAICGTLNWGTYDIPHGYGGYKYVHTFMLWNFYFTMIAKANEIIDFFSAEDPDSDVLRGYLGQAYAARAVAYTDLAFIYADPVTGTTPNAEPALDEPAVPIIYATRDAKSAEEADAVAGRNTLKDVYAEIERNIALAEPLLTGYTRATKNEIDLTVLKGIAARYYLMSNQWGKAAEAAVAAQVGYKVLPLDQVRTNGFMEVNDPEVMWGFNHSTETQTTFASFFSHVSNECSGYGGVGQSVHCIDKQLYDQISSTDIRKKLFNGPAGDSAAATEGAKLPYAGRKFGYMDSWLQDYLYMRVEEMILIEAEAAARQGNGSAAATALKKLMFNRDSAWSQSVVTVNEVLLQRRIELWSEGSEFYDIRRNGLGVDRTYAGTNHLVANQYVFPAHDPSWNHQVPLREVQNNTHITEDEIGEYVDPTE